MDASTPTLTPSLLTEHSSAAPFANEMVVLTKQVHIDLKRQVNYYKAQHKSALERITFLTKQVENEKAKVRDLNQRLYGKKTEKTTKKSEKNDKSDTTSPKRLRGQQPGSKGHGRTQRPDLPVIEEILELSEDERSCRDCGLVRPELGITEDSSIIEIEVKAHARKIKRNMYGRCGCDNKKGIIAAPPAPRLLNRNNIGVSIWTEILLDKFLYAQATYRRLTDFTYLGCPLSQGTVTDGLKRIAPKFKRLIEAFLDKHLSEQLFHADETGWKVFEKIENKASNRWYLWLMQSPSVAYYKMAPGRDAGVPTEHFSGLNLEEGNLSIFLVCDRYSAYGKLVKNIPIILLAFCWAHVRRDFLDAARSWPELKDWMFSWVEDIGELYHLNTLRLAHWNGDKSLAEQTAAFTLHHEALIEKLATMEAKIAESLKLEGLHKMQAAVLTSLKNHWHGLVLFAEHPQIAMDNNLAERGLRNPVTGRKRFYGSGCVWSAELAATMFTIFQTLILWKINPRHWMNRYLNACAEKGDEPLTDLSSFLPWEMTEQQRYAFHLPAPEVEAEVEAERVPAILDSG
jgi:transposase